MLFFVLGLKETAEEMVKNRLEGKDNLTPWQKYLEKKKEKRMLKKKRKVMFALATEGGSCLFVFLKLLLLFALDELNTKLYSFRYYFMVSMCSGHLFGKIESASSNLQILGICK